MLLFREHWLLLFDIVGEVGLFFSNALDGQGVIDLVGLDSRVVLEEVVDERSSPLGTLRAGFNLVELCSGHLFSILKTLQVNFLILIIIQARPREDRPVLGTSSADHRSCLYFIEVGGADHCHDFTNWSCFWENSSLIKLKKCLLEVLNIILNKLITVEQH